MGDMTRRPRLLFLCHTLPYPPDGGPWIRTYNILRLLSRAFDITALCFERAATAGSGASWDIASGSDALGRFARVDVFPIPQRHSRARLVCDHARSAALGRVYTRYVFQSRAFRRCLDELLQFKSFDIAHVDSLDLSGYLPDLQRLPIVCVHHDIQSALLRRRAAAEPNLAMRAYLRYQAALTEREERRWCGRVALNVAVSETDAGRLRELAPEARVAVVPNGVDVDEYRPAGGRGTESGVAFSGGAAVFPNRDALAFFCEEILPHVRGAQPDLPITWIGRASAGQQRFHRDKFGVELTGYVADAAALMAGAACHIVPLRVGGGTRLKILNSWAMGKPVVTTTIGCEGLAAVDGENVLIRDDPRQFADAVLSVLRDERLRRRLGESGRATAERLYSWEVIGASMIDSYRAIINEPVLAAGGAASASALREARLSLN